MNYAALMIDLEKSRAYPLPRRKATQECIAGLLPLLNQAFSGQLAREVTFSAGDEVQGLFLSPEAAYLYSRLFGMLLYPVELKAGIGLGEWDIRLEGKDTTAQDGPAYHRARRAIADAKRQPADAALFYSGGPRDVCVNALLRAEGLISAALNPYQQELYLVMEGLHPLAAHQAPSPEGLRAAFEWMAAQLPLIVGQAQPGAASPGMLLASGLARDNQCQAEDALALPDDDYFIRGSIRGLPGRLAAIAGTSRQNMDNIIRKTRLYELRDFARAIVHALAGRGEG